MLMKSLCCLAAEQKDIIIYSKLTNGYWQIWSVDLDTNEHKQITTSEMDKRNPIYIDNSTKILYRNSNAQMFVFDINSNQEKQILSKMGVIAYPAWSEKNKLLAFTRYEDYLRDESEIWTVFLDGTKQKILTHEPGMQYNSSWSQDGKSILYVSGNSYAKHHIWIMDENGKNNIQLTEGGQVYNIRPVFSPDADKIIFASNRTGDFDIWIMDKDGKNLKNLTNNPAFDSKPSFSLDGKQMVFTSNRSGKLQIWVMNADGTHPRQISEGISGCQDASWSRMAIGE